MLNRIPARGRRGDGGEGGGGEARASILPVQSTPGYQRHVVLVCLDDESDDDDYCYTLCTRETLEGMSCAS